MLNSIVLASSSPRRRELLDQIGVSYEVCPVEIDESWREGEEAKAFVERLAYEKAATAAKQLQTDRPVLAADTIVVLGEKVMGKPANPDHAKQMLHELSGKQHKVMTSVAIFMHDQCSQDTSTTVVEFAEMTSGQIDAYCATGEPFDKAGAYGIQGKGGVFVNRIEGSYSNVVGLPLAETVALLTRTGINIFAEWCKHE